MHASNTLRRSAPAAILLTALGAVAAAGGGPSLQPEAGAPLDGLTPEQELRFLSGRNAFDKTFTVEEGLGPIFNQDNCAGCHANPTIGGSGSIFVTRFGFNDEKGGGFDPLDDLGGSLLQANAIDDACQEVVPASANVTSARITPSVFGIGLVEAIPEADIIAGETNPPPGISGRVHYVEGGMVGRFGWKAQIAQVVTFSGDATLQEMGITNDLFPNENAPNGDQDLLAQCDTVADPEDVPNGQGVRFIDRVTDFQRFVAAPPQTPRSGMTGEAIFVAVGCADCHTPSFTTKDDASLEDALRNKTIKPYSDFLLHDMGLAADFIVDGDAGEREIRTPALWGVRFRDPVWHDGSVGGGTFAERMNAAIALHDSFLSEAQASAQAYAALPPADKDAVIAFLDSLGRREFDANGDNVIDDEDFADFTSCYTGANGAVYTADDPCAVHDLDQDGDIDVDDLAGFVTVFEGTQPDCNGNGTGDLDEIVAGAADLNDNLILDECESCPGDADGDNDVDLDDLNAVLANWNQTTSTGDVTGDGVVDINDLNQVLSNFDSTCN